MIPQAWLDLVAFLFGLVVGSYLNVVIHRLPRRQSTVLGRSRCPFCDAEIRAFDNLPLASFLLLRGRCRRCGAPISWRYPLVETLTGLLFLACVESFGVGPQALVAILFCCLLIVLAAIDLDHYLLPDRLTLPGLAAGLALQVWIPGVTLLEAIVGALVGAGSLILLINFWYWLRHEEAMGLGDVNMLAMIGAFLGWQGVLIALFFGALTGALAGLSLMLAGRLDLRSKLPFGLFLALGALVALFVGEEVAAAYGRLL